MVSSNNYNKSHNYTNSWLLIFWKQRELTLEQLNDCIWTHVCQIIYISDIFKKIVTVRGSLAIIKVTFLINWNFIRNLQLTLFSCGAFGWKMLSARTKSPKSITPFLSTSNTSKIYTNEGMHLIFPLSKRLKRKFDNFKSTNNLRALRVNLINKYFLIGLLIHQYGFDQQC